MSMMMAGTSLAIGATALAISYAKDRMESEAKDAKVWASLNDVQSWGMLGEQRLDANGWPVPAFVYGSMRSKSDIIFDWTTEEVSRHAIISAPTGAGKTWTVFYPTLMFGWTHSCVVHVRKKQMADLTAGWRSRFSNVIWFDPSSMGSAKYNPLDRIRWRDIHALEDAQNFIERLSSSASANDNDGNAVFTETAKDFSAAAIVYILSHWPMSKRNMTGLREAFSDVKGLAAEMFDNVHPHPHVQSELRISANYLLNNPSERFVGSVEATFRSWLRVYQTTILATVTSRSDFNLSDLVTGSRPTTLYIHLPPNQDKRLGPFVRLFMSDLLDEMMTHEEFTRDGQRKRWQLGLIFDEAWRLGKIDALEGAFADMRSYGIRALLGVQGLNQIIDLYGLYNSVFNNARWITSWQNGYDECKRVADMLGEVERERRSTSTSYGSVGPSGSSVSKSMEWRPVVQAAHVSRIPKNRIIIFGEEKPIKAYRTDPKAWQKLIRQVERPETFIGEFLPGPAVPPPVPLLPNLQRYLPAPVQRLLPPPRDGDSPPSDGGNGPTDQPPPRPRRPRRRL